MPCRPAPVSSRRAVKRYDLDPWLSRVTRPVLVWYGGQDPLSVLRPRVLAALRNAELTDVFVEDCGHRPMFQCPDVFYGDVERWMDGFEGER